MATGTLYVVATPIGNLGDITVRAQEILSGVDLIVAEDTRLTGGLIAKLGLPKKPFMALYKERERERAAQVIEALLEGKDVALCSDAGTPAISDPGSFLVEQAAADGITVVPIPGASAITALYSVSGFNTTGFWFEGFLPRKGKARQERLSWLTTLGEPWIIYESPKRIKDTLRDISHIEPAIQVVAGRELTKLHEEIFRGSVAEAYEYFSLKEQRGEFVVAFWGKPHDALGDLPPLENEVSRLLELGLTPKTVTAVLFPLYNVPKKTVYSLAIAAGDKG